MRHLHQLGRQVFMARWTVGQCTGNLGSSIRCLAENSDIISGVSGSWVQLQLCAEVPRETFQQHVKKSHERFSGLENCIAAAAALHHDLKRRMSPARALTQLFSPLDWIAAAHCIVKSCEREQTRETTKELTTTDSMTLCALSQDPTKSSLRHP